MLGMTGKCSETQHTLFISHYKSHQIIKSMLRKGTRNDIDDKSSTHHTEATFPQKSELFPNKRGSIGMVSDDKSLVIDDSILSYDTKTNDNLIAINNSLITIEEGIAFSDENLKEQLKYFLNFCKLNHIRISG
jgi:hypothetical protein